MVWTAQSWQIKLQGKDSVLSGISLWWKDRGGWGGGGVGRDDSSLYLFPHGRGDKGRNEIWSDRIEANTTSAPCCQCKRHCKKLERAKAELRMAVIAASGSNAAGLLGIGMLPCQPQLRDCFLLYAESVSSVWLSASSWGWDTWEN